MSLEKDVEELAVDTVRFTFHRCSYSVKVKKNPKFLLQDISAYVTDGQVLAIMGPSGSGKTMTANAVARKMGKKLLLVNFPLLARSGSSAASTASSVQSIFREAELANAVVFFDECESLFAKRGHGGSVEMTELLTEIERFNGIIFLATNRPTTSTRRCSAASGASSSCPRPTTCSGCRSGGS